MRITSMELAGAPTRDGKGVPGAFARIGCKLGDEFIEVVIITPEGERTHRVRRDCEEDLWSMAQCLQHHLDGCRGTNSMIHDYYRELQRFAE